MIFAKKSLGQNFLIDLNIVKKILNQVSIKNKNIIEIGPGNGALTEEIIKRKPKSLILIEKDKKLAKKLSIRFKKQKFITIFNSDILEFNLEEKVRSNVVIFGNLPYNISSQILVKILKFKKWPPNFSNLILMFQKELSDKIIGHFKSKNYGRLSILTNLRLKLLNKFLVSNNCFFPKPKVTSCVLHFEPKIDLKIKIKNINNLEKVTNRLFSNKRKMIKKNLEKLIGKKKIKYIKGINLNSRPSELEPKIYYKITELFELG